MMSISQLAKNLGISSQAVRQRMSHFDGFIYNHTKMIKHRRYIDDNGVKLIMNSKSNRNRSNTYNRYNYSNGHLVDQLRQELSRQYHQYDQLMKHVSRIDDENKRLTFMLASSNKKADDANNKLLTYHHQSTKHGWLWSLFH